MGIKKTLFRITAVSAIVLINACVGCNQRVTTTKDTMVSVTNAAAVTEDTPYNYDPVKIGDLTWTKQNINIKTPDSWCYEDNESNCAKYGRLYTWDAAKKACASMGGKWRLPTKQDWDNLVGYAGGSAIAGKKLKSKSGWNNNGNGTDDYGFSALPGGLRYSDGIGFYYAGYRGYWWSATESDGGNAYGRGMTYYGGSVYEGGSSKSGGFSVRCVGVVKD